MAHWQISQCYKWTPRAICHMLTTCLAHLANHCTNTSCSASTITCLPSPHILAPLNTLTLGAGNGKHEAKSSLAPYELFKQALERRDSQSIGSTALTQVHGK